MIDDSDNLSAPLENNEEVPVHLFLSPSHSSETSSEVVKPVKRRRRKQINTQQDGTSKEDLLAWVDANDVNASSNTGSPLNSTDSSPKIQPVAPPRFSKTNKVTDIAVRSQSRIALSTGGEDDQDERPSGRSMSSMSNYRDRIRERFIAAKERAAEPLSRPQSRLQRLLLAPKPSKSCLFEDDGLKREEREIAMALERHSRRSGVGRASGLSQRSYEFFLSEPEVDNENGIPLESIGESADDIIVTTEEVKTSASEFLGFRVDDWSSSMIVWTDPILFEPKDISHILFCLSSKPVSLSEKVEAGLNPVSPEDDGIFIGKKLPIPKIMEIHLEQRLLKTPEGRIWFGSDGKLKAFPNELYHKITMHFIKPSLINFKHPSISRYLPLVSPVSDHIVLDIELTGIQFSHHPLFSQEHVLVEKFLDTWEKFRLRKKLDAFNRLCGRLEALRRTRISAPPDQHKIYEKEIKFVREQRLEEGQLDRQMEQKLLSLWNSITVLREQQGYRNSSVKLSIKKMPLDENREIVLEEMLQKEAEEIHMEIFKEYKEKFEEFKKRELTGVIEENEEEPARPKTISEIKEELREKFQKSFRDPNDPEYEFTLSDIGLSDLPPSETMEEYRREDLKKHELQIRMFYNGKEVCHTRGQNLSADFKINFNQRFAVRLLETPQSLMLKVQESKKGKLIWFSDIYLPFPEHMELIDGVEKIEFGCDSRISYSHSGVGSGVEVSIIPNSNKTICLFTTGVINYRLGWARGENGQILGPPRSQLKRVPKVKHFPTKTDFNRITDWAEKCKLDPNDPLNVNIFYSLLKSLDETPKRNQLDRLFEQFRFCSDEDDPLEKNPRLRLLWLRDQGEPEFHGMLAVPLNEKLIHKDIFKSYDRRVSLNSGNEEEDLKINPIDSHRNTGKKYLEQVRLEIFNRFRQASRQKRLEDVIIEDQIPDLGTLGLTLMKWLRPKRPLRPIRKERKKVTVQNLSGQEVNIVVNIIRAFEVPVRKDQQESTSVFGLVNVRPFVEVTFRGLAVRTAAASGANPTWNQGLILPVHTTDLSSGLGTMQSIRDSLYIHLFDEIVIDLVKDEELRATNIHQRLERHWLGALEVPFSTLYFNSKVEGTFKLYTPPILLGYEREAHRSTGILHNQVHQKDATYLTIFITVHPPLIPPQAFEPDQWFLYQKSNETPELEKHVRGWVSEFTRQFPNRASLKPLVSDINGNCVCVTRFIRPLAPPPISFDSEEGLEIDAETSAARFVALIPSVPGTTFFLGLCDIWLTANQMLDYLWGDAEDHAVLLCCFFLSLGKTAFVALGVGIPHGPSAYVITTSQQNEISIWDPCSGHHFSIHDSFCPLQRVHCLINHTNIWANIQPDDDLRRVKFDLNRRSDWLAAFGRNLPVPAESVQPEILDYKPTSRQAVHALKERIETRLRENFMKWRQRKRTAWNRYCASALRKILPELEKRLLMHTSGNTYQNEHFQNIIATYKMYGFPICMPYTNYHAIAEAVRATGVHRVETDNAEFALAVYIYPYHNNILSVWIYLAHLIKNV